MYLIELITYSLKGMMNIEYLVNESFIFKNKFSSGFYMWQFFKEVCHRVLKGIVFYQGKQYS
ncbi:hypothetical protein BMS_1928 [Halobacteriovorax marinus SJ]|uniref:Uncharacterized protein n=1 Tax=Halobacteriovorax marinus (strain ATCC BAA-682 / DSM 15412 / SJ) TaxID=862908 RepID=E1X2H7_HALMS|nr:hypothetical protein BMS_1928 [Halobacteriovorax marinus SJ]